MLLERYLKGYLRILQKNHLPYELIFFVTNKCNSRCKGCFYWKSLNKKIDELSLKEIEKISASLDNISTFLISGGEPFLRKDLIKICEIFFKQNKLMRIHLPTNGLLTKTIVDKTRCLLKKCENVNIIITLPLDGLKRTNDYLRGIKGSFNRVLITLSKLNKLKQEFPNLSTYVNTVVSNKNYNEVEELFNFVKQNFNASYHIFSPVRGKLKYTSIKPTTSKEWMKLSKKLLKFDKYYFLKSCDNVAFLHLYLSMKKYIDKLFVEGLSRKPWPFNCLAGNMIGVLEPNGDVKLCELTQKIGNLRDYNYNFKKIWFSEEANKMRYKLRNCRHCTHACFFIPSMIYHPHFLTKSIVGI